MSSPASPFEPRHWLHPPPPAAPTLLSSQRTPTTPHPATFNASSISSNLPPPIPSCVPGEPNVTWEESAAKAFLQRELSTGVLEALSPNLWIVARRGYENIDPLHRQLIKRRKIVITEEARLHLVWDTERIFVKPIPLCLLNCEFWAKFLSSDPAVATSPLRNQQNTISTSYRPNAVGFLRSYACLIRHYSDFSIAEESHLLPGHYTWEDWSMFLHQFTKEINEAEVGDRYAYGQLRLSHLNWAVRIFRPASGSTGYAGLFYELPYWSTGPYLRVGSILLLFCFAGLSLILSAMQVVIAVPTESLTFERKKDLEAYADAFWGFSLAVILASGLFSFMTFALPPAVILLQLLWNYRHRPRQIPSAQTGPGVSSC